MKKAIIAGLIGFALVASASASLVNSGFESAFPNGWTENSGTSIRDWNTHSGSQSLVLENWDTTTYGYALQQDYAIVGGANYDVSAWYTQDANFNDNGAAAYIEVSWSDTLSGTYYGADKNTSVNMVVGNWAETAYTVTAPAGANFAKVVVGFEGAASGNGSSAYFDDVDMVQAVPEPVSAALLGIGIAFIYALRRKIRA